MQLRVDSFDHRDKCHSCFYLNSDDISLPISVGSRIRRPVGAVNAYTPARAAPVRSVEDMRDNPKPINCSGVYIYN